MCAGNVKHYFAVFEKFFAAVGGMGKVYANYALKLHILRVLSSCKRRRIVLKL